jgi:hypothetical protein
MQNVGQDVGVVRLRDKPSFANIMPKNILTFEQTNCGDNFDTKGNTVKTKWKSEQKLQQLKCNANSGYDTHDIGLMLDGFVAEEAFKGSANIRITPPFVTEYLPVDISYKTSRDGNKEVQFETSYRISQTKCEQIKAGNKWDSENTISQNQLILPNPNLNTQDYCLSSYEVPGYIKYRMANKNKVNLIQFVLHVGGSHYVAVNIIADPVNKTVGFFYADSYHYPLDPDFLTFCKLCVPDGWRCKVYEDRTGTQYDNACGALAAIYIKRFAENINKIVPWFQSDISPNQPPKPIQQPIQKPIQKQSQVKTPPPPQLNVARTRDSARDWYKNVGEYTGSWLCRPSIELESIDDDQLKLSFGRLTRFYEDEFAKAYNVNVQRLDTNINLFQPHTVLITRRYF